LEVAWTQCGLPMSSFWPSRVTICSIGVGWQYLPSPASVA
jgi:hypothetical protein